MNSTGGIQPTVLPQVNSPNLFKSGKFRNQIPELPEEFTDRIKASNIQLLHDYLYRFGLEIPPEIAISVNGIPTAYLEIDRFAESKALLFKTAFIDHEEMPNLRREIQHGLR